MFRLLSEPETEANRTAVGQKHWWSVQSRDCPQDPAANVQRHPKARHRI